MSDELSRDAWRTIRLALAIALGGDRITQRDYDQAMTEVMGTSDRNLW